MITLQSVTVTPSGTFVYVAGQEIPIVLRASQRLRIVPFGFGGERLELVDDEHAGAVTVLMVRAPMLRE